MEEIKNENLKSIVKHKKYELLESEDKHLVFKNKDGKFYKVSPEELQKVVASLDKKSKNIESEPTHSENIVKE